MKLRAAMVLLLFLVACVVVQAQVSFIYDQQTSTDEYVPDYGQGPTMQHILPPWGQSFTPTLDSVEFIRLKFNDGNRYDGLGATVYLNLRLDSISGPILGTTAPVTMPSQFRGVVNFFFPSAITVNPGVIYYFDPVVGSGAWNIEVGSYFNFRGGHGYVDGQISGGNLWFREGIVIPEPAAGALLWLGLAGLLACRQARSSPQSL